MDSRTLKSNQPLVEALAQLDLGGQSSSQGAIIIITDAFTKLPNEMLRTIFGKVQAYHLIRLRLVNKRWKVLIEDILRDKKGLAIMQSSSYKDTLLELSKRPNGQLNKESVFLRMKFNLFLRFYSLNPNVLPFICEYFSSLQMLRFDCTCILTTNMLQHLAQLTHLTELRLLFIRIEMAALDVVNLEPLHNVRTFSLVDFKFMTCLQEYRLTLPPNFDVHQFCRVLSTIFPNVENLAVKSRFYPMLENVLEPHVNLFVNLRSHDFGLIDRLVE